MSLLKKCNIKWLLRRHQQLMATHPIVMNSVQTSLLMTAGDITAQELVEKKGKHYDPLRTARMASIGLMLGPAITVWYRGLDKMFGSEMTMRSALLKVAFVEILLTPPGLAGNLSCGCPSRRKTSGRRPQKEVPSDAVGELHLLADMLICHIPVLPGSQSSDVDDRFVVRLERFNGLDDQHGSAGIGI
uniref:Mitochondrial inner membrane protein Mpv17 n=1 Tax=Lygus hesperus TaxID=30085 RepID=A0A0A9WJH2_LYGHE